MTQAIENKYKKKRNSSFIQNKQIYGNLKWESETDVKVRKARKTLEIAVQIKTQEYYP